MIRRLAFISDIHGNLEALQMVLRDIAIKKITINDVYSLGDLVGYGPRPNEVIELIRKHNIKSVLGNYDEAVGFYLPTCGCNIDSQKDKIKTQNSLSWTVLNTQDKNKEFLREIEEHISFEIQGRSILLTHASPISITDYVFENDMEKQKDIAEELQEDILIFGHTHFPYYKTIENKLFINVGSVGRPKDGDNRACYCILELGEEVKVEFVRVAYDIEKVAKEIEKSELYDIFAQSLRLGIEVK